MKEVKELKKQNKQLRISSASMKSFNTTLDCTKQNYQVKEDETNIEQQIKNVQDLNDGTSKKRSETKNIHIIDHDNKHVGEDNLKCQHCSTRFSDWIGDSVKSRISSFIR